MVSNKKTNIGIVVVAGLILAAAIAVAAVNSGDSTTSERTRNVALAPTVVDNFTEVGPTTHDTTSQSFHFECPTSGTCLGFGTVAGSATTLFFRPMFINLRADKWGWASDDKVLNLESDPRTNWVGTASACDPTGVCAATSNYEYYGWQTTLHRVGASGQLDRLSTPPFSDAGLKPIGAWIVDLVCPENGTCAGAGRAFTTSGSQQPTIFEINKLETTATWKISTWSLPGSAKMDQPEKTRIACSSASRCLAVFPNSTLPYVVQKTNGAWSAPAAVQLPSDAAAQPNGWFQDVACSPNGTCTVVGTYYDNKSYIRMFLASYSATGALVSTKKISTSRDTQSVGYVSTTFTKLRIECPVDNSCVVAGNVALSGSPHAIVVEQTNGTWPDQASFIYPPGNSTPFSTELAYNGYRPEMKAFSCSPDGQMCMVLMRAGYDDVRLMRWQGTWSPTSKVTPPPRAAQDWGYLALDCPTANECHAIWWRGGATQLIANSMTISASTSGGSTNSGGGSSATSTVAPTPTVAPNTTVAPAKPTTLKVGKTLSSASILKLALAQSPATSVKSVVITSSTTSICKKSSKGITGAKVGTCRVAVTGTASGGVKWKASLRITIIK